MSACYRVARLLQAVRTRWPVLFVALALASGGWIIAQRHTEIADAFRQLSWWSTPLALIAAIAGVVAIFRSWLVIVRDSGIGLTTRQGWRVFAVGQIGKYLPGSVWSILGPAQLVRVYGGSATSMAAATIVSLMVSVLVAIVLGGVFLPFSGDGLDAPWFVSLFVLALGVLLYPKILNASVHLVSRLLRRPLIDRPVSNTGILSSVGWACFANLCFGLHVMALAHNFGLTDVRGYMQACAAYSLAAGIGVLIVFAPAGAGAREAVMVLVLGTSMPTSAALTIALLSRVITMVVDFAFAVSQLKTARAISSRRSVRAL